MDMDTDGIVEDVNEEVLVPAVESSFSLTSLIGLAIRFVETNGWFILIGVILAYFIYNKYKNKIPSISATSRPKNEFDEETALKRLRSMEAARLRQQAAIDAAAAKYLEEKKIKEEKAAQEKAEEWERHQQGLGYRSKLKKPSDNQSDLANLGLSQVNKPSSKPKLRSNDYNPLTGTSSSSSGSACYRPSRSSRGANTGG